MRAALLLLGLIRTAGAAPSDLDAKVREAFADFQGTVSIYAKNLDSGADFGMRADEPVRTASTIKLPIMAAVFAAVAEEKVKWTDVSVLHEADKVSGSGILREFADGTRLTLRDLVHVMIVVSDNTATNLVLDRVPPASVNAFLRKTGLERTRVLRKVNGANTSEEMQRYGLGVSTPREMALLLEKIERGRVVSAGASREMIAILKRQQFKDGIGRHMPHPVASKSGTLDRLRSDVGLVYGPSGRVAIASTADDMPKADYSPDNAGSLLIGKLAGILVGELR